MKKFIAIITLAMAAIGANAKTSAPAVDKLNESCPVNVSEGCILKSVSKGDDTVIFVYEVSDDMFGNLEPMKDILHDTMVAEFLSSPDPAMKQMVAYCRETNIGITQRFMSGMGSSFDLVITAADMK